MYKKQLKLQKILCFLALVSSVIIFLYALGIMTDGDRTKQDGQHSTYHVQGQRIDSEGLKKPGPTALVTLDVHKIAVPISQIL